MKTLHFISILAFFVVFATSCGNNDEKTSEKITEKLIENATGNKIDVDIDKNGDKGSMTIKGDDGEEVTFSNEGKEVPDIFPSDIYLPEGEISSVGTIKSGEGNIITIVLTLKESTDKIAERILKEMKANGWKSEMDMTTGEGGLQMYSKDDNSLTVTIGSENDKTQVSYMATIAKK